MHDADIVDALQRVSGGHLPRLVVAVEVDRGEVLLKSWETCQQTPANQTKKDEEKAGRQ